ncbi:GAF domain-containing protein [Archangium violaceum]|uniref:ATP-binding protein n=1 Tax=Archangium violaceum TaxID=83451 RepID=UPI001951AA5F|nr:ATP-binding protein [Archangium violaceum]QRN98378.1 GAF domain-containing protein [Archangium violaceum]
MKTDTSLPGKAVDLTNCAKEPIHIPGAIQPHGVLFALHEPALTVAQVSANVADILGIEPELLLGRPLGNLLDATSLGLLTEALRSDRPQENNPFPVTVGSRAFDGIVHRHQGATLLELEPVRPMTEGEDGWSPQRLLQRALARLQAAENLRELCDTAAAEVRRLTGFERVTIYRFDEEDNGEVLSEDKLEGLDAYLGLHYPASDIPQQARRLYLLNWLRIIPDREYRPAPILPSLRPDNQQPLDLSFSVLRSVSPIHIEYMRNLGLRASMSISLVHGNKLWGLISCGNHSSPRYLSYELRAACELIGRITAQLIGARQEREKQELRQKLRGLQERLVGAMRAEEEEALAGLVKQPEELLGLVGASGAAVFREGRCWTVGRVPPESAIEGLVEWLRETVKEGLFHTRALPGLYPPAETFKEVASGLLAVSLPKPAPDYVLWFRPEVIQTVNWGGDPTKPVEREGQELRLHPRRSFELWKEVVRSTSPPWTPAEVEAAADLRRYAIEVDLGHQVLREQKAVQARDDLVAVVSHDLKNPLGVIHLQVGSILRALPLDHEGPWRRLQNSAERIQRATERMNTLIRDLLDLAKIEAGRFVIEPVPEELESLLEECLESLRPIAEQKRLSISQHVSHPEVLIRADRDRIFQAMSNLMGNAIKFTPEGGTIQLTLELVGKAVRFAVKDTGPGIPAEQLPHLFNRYWQAKKRAREGTGLGLYIAKGIIEAHGGQLWVESQVGSGSTFFFTLPVAT